MRRGKQDGRNKLTEMIFKERHAVTVFVITSDFLENVLKWQLLWPSWFDDDSKQEEFLFIMKIPIKRYVTSVCRSKKRQQTAQESVCHHRKRRNQLNRRSRRQWMEQMNIIPQKKMSGRRKTNCSNKTIAFLDKGNGKLKVKAALSMFLFFLMRNHSNIF
jgi:hypothetical protein